MSISGWKPTPEVDEWMDRHPWSYWVVSGLAAMWVAASVVVYFWP